MNNRLDDPHDTRSDPLAEGQPAPLQDPSLTGSATRPVEAPMTPTDARQGNRGRPVLMVLVAGLVLALIAWTGSEWWAQTTETPAEQTATPPAGDTTPANSTPPPPSTP